MPPGTLADGTRRPSAPTLCAARPNSHDGCVTTFKPFLVLRCFQWNRFSLKALSGGFPGAKLQGPEGRYRSAALGGRSSYSKNYIEARRCVTHSFRGFYIRYPMEKLLENARRCIRAIMAASGLLLSRVCSVRSSAWPVIPPKTAKNLFPLIRTYVSIWRFLRPRGKSSLQISW